MIDICQRVEVDKAGADDRIASLNRLRNRLIVIVPDKEDFAAAIDDFAIGINDMIVAVKADDKGACDFCGCHIHALRPMTLLQLPAAATPAGIITVNLDRGQDDATQVVPATILKDKV